MEFFTTSALILIAREGWKLGKLYYDEWKLDEQLKQYRDPEFLFAQFEDPYLELEARNRLVLAEYQVAREEASRQHKWDRVQSLWGRAKNLMDANLRRTEEALKARPATLYQVAVLNTALAKVAGEAENELAKLGQRINDTAMQLEQTEKEFRRQISRHETGLAAVQKRAQEIVSTIERLEKDLTTRLTTAVEDVESRVSGRCERLESVVEELKNSVGAELAILKSDIEKNLEAQGAFLQEMAQKVLEIKRRFLVAASAVAVWLILLTVLAINA